MASIAFHSSGVSLSFAAATFSSKCAKADVPDFAGILHLLKRAERFFNRNLGIDSVQLIQIEPLEAQPLQTSFDSLFEMFGTTIWHPLAWSRPCETAFCRDDQSFRIRMK